MEKITKKAYEITNQAQLDRAMKYLDSLGYKWTSGDSLNAWEPSPVTSWPIVLSTGAWGYDRNISWASLSDIRFFYPDLTFDNILDAPDYSGVEVENEVENEVEATDDTDGEQTLEETLGEFLAEFIGEFLGELLEMLGLTEEETEETEEVEEPKELDTCDDVCDEPEEAFTLHPESKFIIHMTGDRVVWRIGSGVYGEYHGSVDAYSTAYIDDFSVTPSWYYELSISQLNEVVSLIDKSELESIEIVN